MLDYEYLDKCRDTGLIKAIVRKLKSGEEGHYPHLAKVRVRRQTLRIWGANTHPFDIFNVAMCWTTYSWLMVLSLLTPSRDGHQVFSCVLCRSTHYSSTSTSMTDNNIDSRDAVVGDPFMMALDFVSVGDLASASSTRRHACYKSFLKLSAPRCSGWRRSPSRTKFSRCHGVYMIFNVMML